MRNTIRKMGLGLVSCMMLCLISANIVFAAKTTTTSFTMDLEGNGYYTGRGSSAGEFAIGKDQPVTLATSAYYKIKPNTSNHSVSNKVALRRHTLIGYDTVISYTVFDSVSLGNSGNSTATSTTKRVSKSATTDTTDDYYIYATTSGGSSDYTCWDTFTITYGVN